MIGIKKIAVAAAMFAAMSAAGAAEYPIGKPQIQGGMEVSAVYLQPIKMEPDGMMRKAEESDVHLEADIRAVAKNPNGFAEGDWMPYLNIKFELTKAGSAKVIKGDMMPMVASDGPHYGDNVKLDGPGKYKLKLTIAPPSGHFGRHVDKETGVAPWFKPFELSYDFTFAGVGKKGGY
ncbi:iron transporter [Herbaspirillum rhizosphaerae]|uniref:iron transporter n=1 Tax=Herbaspirillum rhizosphaerae TaxID=346179 RepID=UPI00067E3FE4|nr:iron transporter [Herbaspirillum rhizosphaerae]